MNVIPKAKKKNARSEQSYQELERKLDALLQKVQDLQIVVDEINSRQKPLIN